MTRPKHQPAPIYSPPTRHGSPVAFFMGSRQQEEAMRQEARQERMLTARECAEQLHISVSTFYRAVKAKKYRPGRKVSVRAVRWYPSDIAEKDHSQMAP